MSDSWLRRHLGVDEAQPPPVSDAAPATVASDAERYSDDEFDALSEDDEGSDGVGEHFRGDSGEEDEHRRAMQAPQPQPLQPPAGLAISPPRAPSSPASSLESPDHQVVPLNHVGGDAAGPLAGAAPANGNPLREIMRMLSQMQAVRADAQRAMARLSAVAGGAESADELAAQASQMDATADRLVRQFAGLLDHGGAVGADRGTRPASAATELAPPEPVYTVDDLSGSSGGESEEDDAHPGATSIEMQTDMRSTSWDAKPTCSITVNADGFEADEIPISQKAVDVTPPLLFKTPHEAGAAEALPARLALLLDGLALGGLTAGKTAAAASLHGGNHYAYILSVCSPEEFNLETVMNPCGFSIPAFAPAFSHTLVPLQSLGNGVGGELAPCLPRAFAMLDEWATDRGGRSPASRLLAHGGAALGPAAPAAVCAAWLIMRHNCSARLALRLLSANRLADAPTAGPLGAVERHVGLLIQLLALEQGRAQQENADKGGCPPPSLQPWFGLERAEWTKAWGLELDSEAAMSSSGNANGDAVCAPDENCTVLARRFLSDKRLARQIVALTTRGRTGKLNAAALRTPAEVADQEADHAVSHKSNLGDADFVFPTQQRVPAAAAKHGRRRTEQ